MPAKPQIVILDASIAVKWFFKDEVQAEAANSILHNIVEDPRFFLVPDLFYIEVMAVLLRKSKSSKFASQCLDKIYRLGIKSVPVGRELLMIAGTISEKFGLTIYDGIYIATADLMGGRWLTADKRASSKVDESLVINLS